MGRKLDEASPRTADFTHGREVHRAPTPDARRVRLTLAPADRHCLRRGRWGEGNEVRSGSPVPP